MKNLGVLFRYEMRKIWRQKLTWVAAVLLTVVCVGNASLFWWAGREAEFPFSYTAEDGTQYTAVLTDYEQIAREGANGSKLDGQVWDEDFFQAMHRSLPQVGENSFQLNCWLYAVDPTWFAPVEMTWTLGLEPDTVTAGEFYQARREMARARLAVQGVTEAEKAHWRAQEERIQEPFTYEYCKGARYAIGRMQSVALLLPFAVAAALCGVFSGERTTAPLLFVSVRGRFPLALAKTLAGSLTAAVLALVAVTATYLTEWVLLGGGPGFGAPIQLCDPCSGLTLSVGGALLVLSGLLVLYGVLFGGLVMLLSAMGSSTAALALSFLPGLALIVLMAWGRPVGRWTDWLPYNLISAQALSNGHMAGPLELFQAGGLLYTGIAAGLLALCWLGWRRWAVSGKSRYPMPKGKGLVTVRPDKSPV